MTGLDINKRSSKPNSPKELEIPATNYSSNESRTATIKDSDDVKLTINNAQLADGYYCYEGYWNSNQYPAQKCRIKFTKKEDELYNCSYTNLLYSTTIQLNGQYQENALLFIGKIDGKENEL